MEVLKSSGIAVEVKRLRISTDTGVRIAASALLSRWKDKVRTDEKRDKGKQAVGAGNCRDEQTRKRSACNIGEQSARRKRETGSAHTQFGEEEMQQGKCSDKHSAPVSLDKAGYQGDGPHSGHLFDPCLHLSRPAEPNDLDGCRRKRKRDAREDTKKDQRGKMAKGEENCRRERAREVLLRSLVGKASTAAREQHQTISRDLESQVWALGAHDTEAYIKRIQTLKFNLTKNAQLGEDLMAGTLSASQVAKMSTQALAGCSTKDKRRRHLSEAAFQDSMYITAKEGGAHSRDFTCPQCGARDALFRHEHLLPDNFWSYNDTAYQGACSCCDTS